MIKYLETTKEYAQITGYKNLKIKDSKDFVKEIREKIPHDVWIQFFDSSVVATWQHLLFAIISAQLGFRNQKNISKSIEMETLLYASAQHQIKKAIKNIGVKNDSTEVALIIVAKEIEKINSVLSAISKKIGRKSDEKVLEFSDYKQEKIRIVFEINQNELEAVIKEDNIKNAIRDIVLEKMALLSTKC